MTSVKIEIPYEELKRSEEVQIQIPEDAIAMEASSTGQQNQQQQTFASYKRRRILFAEWLCIFGFILILCTVTLIILASFYANQYFLMERLYEVDCRVAGCRFNSYNYHCNFIYNGTNSSILAANAIARGITLPVATIGLSTQDASVETVAYEYLGSLQVESGKKYYTDKQDCKEKMVSASAFNDYYINKTRCLSDPDNRSKIYFDILDLAKTLLSERVGLIILTVIEVVSLSIVIFSHSKINQIKAARSQPLQQMQK